MSKIKIQDESGDKKYFTIIPNYILNHSTANDQALYSQMKRYAGEGGECFASEIKLRKQLGIGRIGLKKSIQYLLDHKWISHKGIKQVMTRGGLQDINVYVVNDIWNKNNEYYKGMSETTYLKGVAPDDIPLARGVVETEGGGVQNNTKGVVETTTKKNHKEEEPLKEDIYTFEKFWLIYPKKVGKGTTEKLWNNLSPEIRSKILDDIPRRKFDDKWLNGFIKDPERYIKSKQWEDEIIIKQKNNGTHKPDNIVQAREGKYSNLS